MARCREQDLGRELACRAEELAVAVAQAEQEVGAPARAATPAGLRRAGARSRAWVPGARRCYSVPEPV